MRPEGATLSDLTAASGWLPHTTRADAVLELPKKKARPVGGLPEVGPGLQAVDRRRDGWRSSQEGDVVLVEAPVLPGVDLEHAPGRPLAAYHSAAPIFRRPALSRASGRGSAFSPFF